MRLPRHLSTPSFSASTPAAPERAGEAPLARRRAIGPMALIVGALVGALATPAALAQYKWVGPGGTVTYSDLPPPPGVAATTLSKGAPRAASDASATSDGALPGAVRTAAAQYPVVLYTTKDCAPCQQARVHLQQRGVPFAERTIETQLDAQAFKKLGFAEPSVPAIAVGRERLTGFEPEQWRRLLDAAQYPASSKLPAGYRAAPAQRLASGAERSTPQDKSDAQAAGSSAPSESADPSKVAPMRTRAAAVEASGSARASATTLRF